MGADGHIKIYDPEKLRNISPATYLEGNVYQREIFGKKVLTMYWDSEWIDKTCMYCGLYGCSDVEHQKKVEEIDKVALIDKWEVWT